MQTARDVLTPDSLAMLQAIATTGSFAAAARSLGLVPSALTYRVRQIEDALDVLLFDRSSRQARLTPAGAALLEDGARLLDEIDAVAHRVKRVATGWEAQFTIAADSVISRNTLFDLCDKFLALNPPTRLKIRDEVLSGTTEAVTSGLADIAIGSSMEAASQASVQSRLLGNLAFVYAVAPHHPLATAAEPVNDDVLRQHRAVAVADSSLRGRGITVGLLGGQDVFTVPSMQAKLEAQLRGLGAGFLPECMARPYVEAGHLIVRKVDRMERVIRIGYAWRQPARGEQRRALQWWLDQLDNAGTRSALLEQHHRT
ncbi:MAG: LysR family transcriptional regulator [Comamonadaceae bacterium]|nr:MAG: LysR family transcriptional regulator [Comamonadaceae bacterium]